MLYSSLKKLQIGNFDQGYGNIDSFPDYLTLRKLTFAPQFSRLFRRNTEL